MTQSFDSSLSTEKDWVRFQIGDTNDEGMYIEDESIQYFINDSSKEDAVIQSIEYIITQLSSPDTRLDWLTVSYADAREGYENLLLRKRNELGIQSVSFGTTNITYPWRVDTAQTDGDYNENE